MDTHIHTKASDGKWRPSEVVKQAKNRGLEVIAITDHDTTFGLDEALKTAKEIGLQVIPGIEIDAVYNQDNVKVSGIELLGLGIDQKLISPFVDKATERRQEDFEHYVEEYNKYIESKEFIRNNHDFKYPLLNPKKVSSKDVFAWKKAVDDYENNQRPLSQWDFAYYLLDNFVAPSKEVEKAKTWDQKYSTEFRDEYKFIFGWEERKETRPSFYEAIQAVKKANGKAVLAHPGKSTGYKKGMIKEWEQPEEEWFRKDVSGFTPYKLVKDLQKHGLDGVELYYYKGSDKPHADQQDRINYYFSKMADKLGLIKTKGSDCHGPNGKGILMGQFGSERLGI